MTRRGWKWALGLVACGTLLPACSHTVPGVVGSAVPMDAADAGAIASATTTSPYNARPSVGDKPATLVPPAPTMTAAISNPSAAAPIVDHRDTLAPDPDPTPSHEPFSVQLTAVAAAPRVLRGPLVNHDPTAPTPGPKAMAVASLSGLTPAGSTRPDHLPPVTASNMSLPADRTPIARKPPAPPYSPLVEAMRLFLDNHPGDALLRLKGYDKDNQELLLLLLPLAARLAEGKLSAANVQDTMYFYDQLNSLLVCLRPRLSLVIDRICFCRDIRGFGMYQPLPGDCPAYRRGEHVDIYVQVRNFSSTRQVGANGGPVYVTQLKTSAEIVTRDKRIKVWPPGNDRFVFHRDGPDICQALRHDYFDHCYFTLPQELPPGAYTLSLQVEDEPTKRVARESLDFKVR